MTDNEERQERVARLRELLGDWSVGFTIAVANDDGTITTTDLGEDGVCQYRSMWMPPAAQEDHDESS